MADPYAWCATGIPSRPGKWHGSTYERGGGCAPSGGLPPRRRRQPGRLPAAVAYPARAATRRLILNEANSAEHGIDWAVIRTHCSEVWFTTHLRQAGGGDEPLEPTRA
jgi:hypothetical protein